jgi:hypothetical protein
MFHTHINPAKTNGPSCGIPLNLFYYKAIHIMALLSVEELSQELSVPMEFIKELISREVIIPYGGRARLGEPRFSAEAIPQIRNKVESFTSAQNRAARP